MASDNLSQHRETLRLSQPSPLCKYCQQIDYAQLRCPSFEQLTTLRRSTSSDALVHFDAKSSVSTPVPLGTLARIKDSASDCPVCDLIWRIIVRNNYGEEPLERDSAAGEREKECFAFVGTYGKFSESSAASKDAFHSDTIGLHNLVRRLSLRIGVPPAPEEDDADCFWWTILFCVQSCAATISSVDPVQAFESPATSQASVFGARQRPLLLDTEWIRAWLQSCERNHRENCGSTQSLFKVVDGKLSAILAQSTTFAGHLPDFRLINVSRKCIEAFNADDGPFPEYAALSYVWGKDQRLKLRTTNESSLMHPGAFDTELPSATIVDAIDLLARLSLPGVQHLWVDALCIVQDSDADKQRQIGRMGEIYTNAAFTVVAAAGVDADAGLPGIRCGSRTVHQSVVPIVAPGARTYAGDGLIQHDHGLAIVDTLNPLTHETDDFWTLSKYSTRGWTMQERVLSKRNLIFTDEQVYWQCVSATYCEESHMECSFSTFQPTYTGATRFSIAMQNTKELVNHDKPKLDSSKTFWNHFSALANRFSELDFSFEGDVLDGFSGITTTLQDISGEMFIWGMPTSRMGLALLWEDGDSTFPDDVPVKRRLERTTLPVSSFQKRLRVPSWSWLGWSGIIEINLGDDEGYIRAPEVVPYVHEPGGTALMRLDQDGRGKFAYKPLAVNTAKFQDAQWKGSTQEVTLADVANELPALSQMLSNVPEQIVLFFWASMSSFRIHTDGDRPKILTPTPSTSPDASAWVCSKGPTIGGQVHYWVGSLFSRGDRDWNKTTSRRRKEELFDFIVVGSMPSQVARTLIVMHIGFNGDVAMRLGLGTINEDAWIASQPEWKLVALG